jgi:acetyltransferase-like isoleucine patch superfamily enzyme
LVALLDLNIFFRVSILFKNIAIKFFFLIRFDRFYARLQAFNAQLKAKRISLATNQKLNFIPQGGFEFEIMGPLEKFKIKSTSHIKSETYIECSGGVEIGSYFHAGRALTIFSSTHNFKDSDAIPYDSKVLYKPVIIEDFVWCGANVVILPGVVIGEGAIIGAGTVVTKSVPVGAIYVGNPGKIIGYRDLEQFFRLKSSKRFY